MEPGANPPVDEYPILKLIPRRFAFWKTRAIAAGETMDSVWGEAVTRVEKRRSVGDRRDSITDTLLDKWGKENMPMTQHGFNNLVGELVEGAADTTAAQLLTLVMAFAKNPRVQKRAQEEISKVCGVERSPLWSDFNEFPYVNAIVKEGMRWRPVAVTGSPHRVRQGKVSLP
jgi:cytochrome P450